MDFYCNNCNKSFRELRKTSLEYHLYTLAMDKNAEINEYEDHLVHVYNHEYKCPLCKHPAKLHEFIPLEATFIRNSIGCAIPGDRT